MIRHRPPIGTSSRMRGLGLVSIGSGGSASDYTFDADGLSNDPRLAPYLQSLTMSQLQAALNNQAAPLVDMICSPLDPAYPNCPTYSLVSCQQSWDPTICGPKQTNPLLNMLGISGTMPSWAWWAGAAVLGAVLIGGTRR